MKIMTVVGARPQFIKAAALSRVLRSVTGIEEVLVHTGQHYDENMSGVFFKELEIHRPDHDLEIGSAPHGAQTGRMLEAVERVILEEKPDCVLVYGDTNSTLAGALAAVKLHVPVAHVEAGLRSFNRRMPEEINRVLTDHASDTLFAPTEVAASNLRREGIPESRVHQVGDVMYDAALHYGAKAEAVSGALGRLGLEPKGYVIATVHRAENTDAPARLQAVFQGLATVADEIDVVVPLHPRTREALRRAGLDTGRVVLTDPVSYLDMMMLLKNARLVVTDSGGVQKEAFFHHVPCVTLRDETEWTELVDLGWNRLVPPRSAEAVADGVRDAMRPQAPADAQPYGDGRSAARILEILSRGR